MAEAMISEQYRESLQSLDNLEEQVIQQQLQQQGQQQQRFQTFNCKQEKGPFSMTSSTSSSSMSFPTIASPSLGAVVAGPAAPLPQGPSPSIMTSINSNNSSNNNSNNNNKRVTHGPTVVIQIPQKRAKVSLSPATTAPSSGPKQVIDVIANALNPTDRKEALYNAISVLDHNVTSIHDEELNELSADLVLTKHLGYLISRRTLLAASMGNIDPPSSCPASPPSEAANVEEEISLTCEALEMIYRASPQAISQSYNKCGTELLASLIYLINQQIQCRQQQSRQTPTTSSSSSASSLSSSSNNHATAQSTSSNALKANEGRSVTPPSPAEGPSFIDDELMGKHDVMLKKATKVLGHFARVGSVTQPMAYYPPLLPCLVNILMQDQQHTTTHQSTTQNTNNTSPSSNSSASTTLPSIHLPSEVRLNALWIVANLACNSDNMVMMACHPDFLTALVYMASRTVRGHDAPKKIMEIYRSQSIASRAIVNLSWAPENRIPMSERMDVVQAMITLASSNTRTTSSSDANASTAMHAKLVPRGRTVSNLILQTRRHALGALRNLASTPRRNKLQLCQHNGGKLLHVLTDAVLDDSDNGVIKTKAFETIHNLASQDTAECMVQHPALILALKDASVSEQHDANNEQNTCQTCASKTLTILERCITPDKSCYQALRELLDSYVIIAVGESGTVNGNGNATQMHDNYGVINNNHHNTSHQQHPKQQDAFEMEVV